ncbi:hypothetical protein BDV95DRAFT_581875 [Massariosphaeria phaeospora]|uniref:FAR1 domain-containing protein n=1 Tax=Massariosphaeria phaeospora TaxID=100035 RepID=A0A7C8M4B4_9PLEO|nr:hypothetical protein BDV95DRAFT_581875 [Massariosphaeria phaeospora]
MAPKSEDIEPGLPVAFNPDAPDDLYHPEVSLPEFLPNLNQDYHEVVKLLNQELSSKRYGVTIRKTKQRGGKKRLTPEIVGVDLRCACGRKFSKRGSGARDTSTRMKTSGDPCLWRGYLEKELHKEEWKWRVHVINPCHNHAPSQSLALPQFRQVDNFARGVI